MRARTFCPRRSGNRRLLLLHLQLQAEEVQIWAVNEEASLTRHGKSFPTQVFLDAIINSQVYEEMQTRLFETYRLNHSQHFVDFCELTHSEAWQCTTRYG